MSLIILNGPTGTGKNTIADIVASKRDRCVIIDFDTLRNMVKVPHKAPWEGEEGKRQNFLGVRNACALARNFIHESFDCIILDVLQDETARLYKTDLNEFSPTLIFLLPTYAEIQRRNRTRPPRLSAGDLERVYRQQEKLHEFDLKIDTTLLSPEDVANRIIEKMNNAPTTR